MPKHTVKRHFASRRLFALTAALLVFIGLFSSSEIGASYNDARYDEYKNMDQSSNGHARYIVPNLYRQDASYTNVKTFPLVVSGETDYVPLDIFARFSYLEVVYGKNSYSFYINNTNNGRYVVFDIAGKTATSFDGDLEGVEAKLYYQTYYVPAKIVCTALKLTFEAYDSPEDGIRACRISDSKAKYTLSDLVAMYSPVKKEPTSEATPDAGENASDTPNDDRPSEKDEPKKDTETETPPSAGPKPDVTDKTDEKLPIKEELPDPYEGIAARELYLTFENQPNPYTKALLDTLKNAQVKAVFFVEKDKILEYPELVRRMLTDGHTVGLYAPASDGGTVLSNEQIGESLSEAQAALRLVTKSETRLVRLAGGQTDTLRENGFAEYAAEHGYQLYDATLDASESGKAAASAAEALFATLAEQPRVKRTEHIGFVGSASTEGTVERLIEFCQKYKQFHLASPDETASLPSRLAEQQ